MPPSYKPLLAEPDFVELLQGLREACSDALYGIRQTGDWIVDSTNPNSPFEPRELEGLCDRLEAVTVSLIRIHVATLAPHPVSNATTPKAEKAEKPGQCHKQPGCKYLSGHKSRCRTGTAGRAAPNPPPLVGTPGPAKPKPPTRCGKCGDPGHNARTCKGTPITITVGDPPSLPLPGIGADK